VREKKIEKVFFPPKLRPDGIEVEITNEKVKKRY
jgi:hypothetical protein